MYISSYLWALVNDAETIDELDHAEIHIRNADIEFELFDELMMALTYKIREWNREH